MKIELTEQQSKNLIGFLSRVQLQGSETPAFNDIVKAVQTPAEEPKKEVEGEVITKEDDKQKEA
jgi:hypothetical protein